MFSINLSMLYLSILSSIRCLIVGVWMEFLMPAVMIVYLSSLWVVAASWNLSLEYVNSKICTLVLGLGVNMGLTFGGTPITHRMSGHRWDGRLHFGT
jgi:hypothetical protein